MHTAGGHRGCVRVLCVCCACMWASRVACTQHAHGSSGGVWPHSPEQRIGHRVEKALVALRLATPRRARRARASAAANSKRRPLQYGENDDPCKMTYSRMAFFGRPCVRPTLPAKCRHTGALAGSRCTCTGRTQQQQHWVQRSFERPRSHDFPTMALRKMVPDTKKPRARPPRQEARHAAWSEGEACCCTLTHEQHHQQVECPP